MRLPPRLRAVLFTITGLLASGGPSIAAAGEDLSGPVATELITAAEVLPHVIRPGWLHTPTSWDIIHAYPSTADGASGRAVLLCRIGQGGRFDACKVIDESASGFGAAAMRVAPRFQMRGLDAEGSPVAGRLIRIPFEFHPPR